MITGRESSIYVKRIVEREGLEDRVSLIGDVCQLFREGYQEGFFTFKELRRACRFLCALVRSVDADAGDLCRLASNAETIEQFRSVCRMSRQRWGTMENHKENDD